MRSEEDRTEERTVYPNPALDAELAYRREQLHDAGRPRRRAVRRSRWLR